MYVIFLAMWQTSNHIETRELELTWYNINKKMVLCLSKTAQQFSIHNICSCSFKCCISFERLCWRRKKTAPFQQGPPSSKSWKRKLAPGEINCIITDSSLKKVQPAVISFTSCKTADWANEWVCLSCTLGNPPLLDKNLFELTPHCFPKHNPFNYRLGEASSQANMALPRL